MISWAMLTGNLPRLVPPYFCTTQFALPGRSFSCWCSILSPKEVDVVEMGDMVFGVLWSQGW